MKIALIGPGIMSIPPLGWGAVEILIWDYFNELTKLGHDVKIINKLRLHPSDQLNPSSPYCLDLIREINEGNFDFVHLHYDCLYHILPLLTAKKVGITSHYPYIDNINKHQGDGVTPIFNFMVTQREIVNFILAKKDLYCLQANGANPQSLFLLENGISPQAIKCDLIISNNIGNLQNKSLYLGQINERKGQHKYCQLQNIDIIGPGGNASLPNYKGTWTRAEVQTRLTEYGNLLLLSKGEADPLVVKEALMAGLGVVVNATSAKNLIINYYNSIKNTEIDFITIIADEHMDNLAYIQNQIDENRQRSLGQRANIRAYAEACFAWTVFIEKYVKNISN